MKHRSSRICLLFGAAATCLIGLNGCCCPCNSKARLLEDFWVGPEQRVQWLQHQRAADSGGHEQWKDSTAWEVIDDAFQTHK